MKIGVIVINFGEPEEPTVENVEAYLERIFLQNASLESDVDEARLARTRQLARARAPALVEEYESIGGSPLNAQAEAQALALERELEARTWDVHVYSAFQFTSPFVPEAVARAREDGVEALVGLPVYPMCGHSTNVAALDAVSAALDELAWAPRFVGLSGWHHHPAYLSLRVDHIRAYLEAQGLDLEDPDTLLYFSVHGTPVRYLSDGNRYDRYVEEHCREVARRLSTRRYGVGFQNHADRGIPWTRPDNEDATEGLEETKLVVVPISFMHEQSETLAELDDELRAYAEGLGKSFHRVPVPHDAPRFPRFLADLVAESLAADDDGGTGTLSPCRCRPDAGTWCTNGARDLPPSPYIPEDAGAPSP